MSVFTILKKSVCLGIALTLSVGGFADAAAVKTSPTAVTTEGKVQGFQDKSGNSVYLGVPYAATTGGQNRWKAPQGPAKYSVLNASKFGPTCPQAITGTAWTHQDEDCLSVNIWAPSKGKNLPVFVYIYGGAMVTGSSSNTQLQGNNFARKGVVYVSFNTRESIFASPNSAELGKDGSQNFGILDVEKAMDWIRANVAAFGGNPDHIVLGGHSSGGVHVDHYLWNHPKTWLAGAIEMSANAVSGPGYAPTNVGLDAIAKQVGCPTGAGQLACLRKVDVYALQTADFNATVNTWFTPIVDSKTRWSVADYVKRFKAGLYPTHVPLITGNSNGEGTIFGLVYGGENTNFSSWIRTFDADVAHIPHDVLLNAYNATDYASVSLESGTQYGDARFDCAVDYLVDLRSNAQTTWSYRWFGAYDNIVGVPGTAPTHGTEIPFFLGGNECFDSVTTVTAAEQKLADFTNDWFVNWIKNPSAGPGWEKVQPQSGVVMKLGTPGSEEALVKGRTSEYNNICQNVYKKYFPLYPVVQSPVALAVNLNLQIR